MQHSRKRENWKRCVVAAAALCLALSLSAAGGSGKEFRSITEVGNNVEQPLLGSSSMPLIRKAPLDYADGISEPNGQNRPNPRLVSLTICQQDDAIPAKRNTSDFLWTFGVFVNHDLDITEAKDPSEYLNIPIPKGDPFFDPGETGTQVISFRRGNYVEGTGTSVDNPRVLENTDTGFLDLSTVYGSDDDRADWLRTKSGGKMKVTQHPLGDLLPFNDGTQINLGQFEMFDNSNTKLFLAGDVRANISAALATMHTLWVRNHNWWADKIAGNNPNLDDEDLYQMARQRNIAELENIALYQWLPALLGDDAVPPYSGYNSKVDPTCAVEFTTVILRSVGHTLLPTEILRLDEDGKTIAQGNVRLRDLFFDNTPPVLESAGIEPFLRGLAAKRCQESDRFFVDDIHNFLFTVPGGGGQDLISLNIQRARDFGIPDYNSLREAYGLSRVDSFDDITSDKELADQLQSLYATVDDIDPFIGAVCEDHVEGGSVGELIRTGMLDQLLRIRDGDRFWFEASGQFSDADLEDIRNTTLADVIKRNTNIQNIQANVFFVENEPEVTPTGPNNNVCGAMGAAGVASFVAGFIGFRTRRRYARG